MDTSFLSQWPLTAETSQQALHDVRTSLDEWSKERPGQSLQATMANPATSSHATPSIADINDLMNELAETGATQPSSSSLTNALSSTQQPSYFMNTFAPFYAPFNTVPYGMPWSQQTTTSIPVSNYSSLNGATTSMTSGSTPTSPPHPSPQTQQVASGSQQSSLVIDPSLATLNSNANNHFRSPTLSTLPSNQQQATRYVFAPPHTVSAASLGLPPQYNPSQRQQPQSTAQGTLSPQSLHAGNFYGMQAQTSTPPSSLSLSERNQQLLASIRPLLLPAAFTGAQAVHTLVTRIVDTVGASDVDAATRLEILTKIRDGAGNPYFRAWCENITAMDITRDWLKTGFQAGSDSQMVETIMPLLHIIDRLPFNLDSLKASKLGKLIVKLVKEPPSPAIKDMASNIERKWRQMVNSDGKAAKSTDNDMDVDLKSKKRKPSEAPSGKALPPAKKPAVGTSTAVKPISNTLSVAKKKEASTKPTVVPAVKDAKSDSSFFSAPKPKPKLPNFKKAPPQASVKKEPEIAQPSSIDPFQEALKSMTGRRGSPSVAQTPPQASSSTPPLKAPPSKLGKKGKSVSWAPDNQLVQIREIERAIYDDDPADGHFPSHSIRELDRGEGAAMHAHLFEETVDWSDPLFIEFPPDLDIRERGESSLEKQIQDDREQTALGALYMTAAQIPDSPTELTNPPPDDEVDKDVKQMTLGDEFDSIFPLGLAQGATMLQTQSLGSSVADLIAQLTHANPSMAAHPNAPLDSNKIDAMSAALSSLSAEQLQSFLGTSMTQPSSHFNNEQTWGALEQYNYQQTYQEDSDRDRSYSESRGRGRRGRGKGIGRGDDGYKHSKRKPCTFFQVGRCKYGEHCDFAHELIS